MKTMRSRAGEQTLSIMRTRLCRRGYFSSLEVDHGISPQIHTRAGQAAACPQKQRTCCVRHLSYSGPDVSCRACLSRERCGNTHFSFAQPAAGRGLRRIVHRIRDNGSPLWYHLNRKYCLFDCRKGGSMKQSKSRIARENTAILLSLIHI